jgi:hypothetical protein
LEGLHEYRREPFQHMFHLRVLLSLFFFFVFKLQSSEFLYFSIDKGLLESLHKNQRDRVVEFLRETTAKIPISIQKYVSGSWSLEFKYYRLLSERYADRGYSLSIRS